MTFFLAAWGLCMLAAATCRHPLALALMLVAISLISAVLIWSFFSLWVGVSLVLVFVGGMMVLFLYIASLNNEEKIVFPLSLPSALAAAICLSGAVAASGPPFSPRGESALSSLLFQGELALVLCLLSYLILLLFVVVKGMESFKGALIKKL